MDIYLPKESDHAKLRIRKQGDKYEITKKTLINENDLSIQKEHNIPLSFDEFTALSTAEGKRVHKIRYDYNYEWHIAQIDVFQDDLKGLVLVDIEFTNEEEKNNFKLPDFCLVEVTQDEAIAGGMLCGKIYADMQWYLDNYNYVKLEQ